MLLGAGVPVEVCRVKDKAAEEEREERDKEREARKTKGKVGGSNGPVNGNNGGSSNGSLKRNISSNSNSGNNKATAKSRINGGPPKTPTPKGATRTPLKRGGSGGASLHEPIVLDDSDDDDIEVVDVKRRKV